MNENNQNFEKQTSGSTGDVSDRNRILREHAEKFPEGDPSVRRVSPEKGTIGVGERKGKENKGPEKEKSA